MTRLRADQVLADRIRFEVSGGEVRALGPEVLAALGAGVPHPDIEPGNVPCVADGSAKLVDFGIAMALETPGEADDATRTSTAPSGHPAAKGLKESPETVASDSLGRRATVYQALSEAKPLARADASPVRRPKRVGCRARGRSATRCQPDARRVWSTRFFVTARVEKSIRGQPFAPRTRLEGASSGWPDGATVNGGLHQIDPRRVRTFDSAPEVLSD